VHDDAWDPDVGPAGRNGQVYGPCRPVSEADQFGRRFVTQQCTISGFEGRRPELAATRQWAGERGVDAGVDPLPSACYDIRSNAIWGQPSGDRLRSSQHAGLVLCHHPPHARILIARRLSVQPADPWLWITTSSGANSVGM
jgi:hypothetical protein